MAIVEMELDPNAATYTDDQIVEKVNAATTNVSADKVADGTTNKAYTATEKTKLTGIETAATADQTGAEIRDAVVALSDTDRKIVITSPVTGEFKVISIQRKSTGKAGVKYDNVAV